MGQLSIETVSLQLGTHLLLDGAHLQLMPGEHVALIGANGAGKTSLLKLLLGQLEPMKGEVRWSKGARIGSVAQDPPADERTPIEVVLEADTVRQACLDVVASATDPFVLAEAYATLEQIQADGAPARAARLLAGLGFCTTMQSKPCSSLSGGWRGRVALASALFAEHDWLILDEPTNHLDLESAAWLTQFLKRYPRGILLVSHDAKILNAVPQRTIHLHQRQLTSYRGNLEAFQQQYALKLAQQESARQKTEAHRAHLQSFVDRFRAKASKARQAQSRLKALERLPTSQILETGYRPHFHWDCEGLPPELLTCEKVTLGYEQKPVLQEVNFRILPGDRIALLGPNGNGKSTLLKAMAGLLHPFSGTRLAHPKLKVGYFAQHLAEQLNLDASILNTAASWHPHQSVEQLRRLLGTQGFGADKIDQRVGSLSGGEKARLLLALVASTQPHLLLLDEPTNHLDLEARQALAQSLLEYPGAVVLVSHDVHLVELCTDTLWLVDGGACTDYKEDLATYCATAVQGRDAEEAGPRKNGGGQRACRRQREAERRRQLAPLKKKLDTAEARLNAAAEQKASLEEALHDPLLYGGDTQRLLGLQQHLQKAQQLLFKAEQEWLLCGEQYEEALQSSPVEETDSPR